MSKPSFNNLVPMRLLLPIAALACAASSSANAQCTSTWSTTFGLTQIYDDIVTSIVFDPGTGPALFLATAPGSNGNNGLLEWNGTTLSGAGDFFGGFANPTQCNALCVFDDGSGPALYAGGFLTHADGVSVRNVARWNPSTGWTAVGNELGEVFALAVYNDGSGPHLYASANNWLLARWNGTAWIDVGQAGGNAGPLGALVVHDDGSGPALYVGGAFTIASAGATNIARWTAAGWSSLGAGTNGLVTSLAAFNDGTGPALYVGGSFLQAGANPASRIARWNGTSWSALGSGTSSSTVSLTVFDDGTGRALYAAGGFFSAGGATVHQIARWNGSSWSPVGAGMDGYVSTLSVFDPGGGQALFAGGQFTTAGGLASPHLAKWKSTGWSSIDGGQGLDARADALLIRNEASGPALYCGGNFARAGTTPAKLVARWDGAHWSALGSGLAYGSNPTGAEVFALAEYDDASGAGSQIYAGGIFDAPGVALSCIAKWDGAVWSSLGTGVDYSGRVYCLCVFDDGSGPELYAGGDFTEMGGVHTNYIARWNGTNWSSVGGGTTQDGVGAPYAGVHTMTVWDDGTGPALYVGGVFPSAGGVAGTAYLARWRGGSWSSLGTVSGFVYALKSWNDGSGDKLYIGGQLGLLGSVAAGGIGTFDGTSFGSVAGGFPGQYSEVRALTIFDEGVGVGAHLYAGGRLGTVGTVTSCSLARLDGSSWAPIGALTSGSNNVASLASFDAGSGPALYVAGWFGFVDGTTSANIARFASNCPDPIAFCFGTASACPCGNAGASGNGCATSFNANGAHLGTSGVPSLANDTLALVGTGTSSSFVTYFQGTQRQNGGAGSVFGDGLRCAGGNVIRLASVLANGGASQYPNAGNPSVSVRGQVTTPGSKRTYQAWFRNAANFCTPSTFNLSNGVEVTWIQ